MFERTKQLIGEDHFDRLASARVIIFGVGGVGGWCAEALVRTGIRYLTIVDMDVVAISNLNRQIVATSHNIGEPKVEEMKKRLLTINPEAEIIAWNAKYDSDGMLDFGDHKQTIDWTQYDCVVDAIDSLDCKTRLIYEATHAYKQSDNKRPTLFSSMGAGRKINTEQIRVSEFWKVEGCPLARALRTKMKKGGLIPQTKFMCVSSPEIVGTKGTVAPIVGVFGMKLASLVINLLME